MKRIGVLLAGAAAAVWLCASGLRPEDKIELVVTEEAVFALLPPEAVASHGIEHIEWSPSGKFLLMVQQSPKILPNQVLPHLFEERSVETNRSLLVWNRETGKTTVLGTTQGIFGEADVSYWSADDSVDDHGNRLPIEWLPGKDVGVAHIDDPYPLPPATGHRTPLRLAVLDLNRGTAAIQSRPGVVEGLGWFFSIEGSTKSGKLLILQTCVLKPATRTEPYLPTETRMYLWTLDPFGGPSAPVSLGNGGAWFSHWLEDGKTAFFRVLEREQGARKARDVFFDADEGRLIEVADPKRLPEPETRVPVEIRFTPTQINVGTVKATHRAVWLSATGAAERPAVLVAAGADDARFSDGLDRIALRHKGVVTVRPVVRLSRSVWIDLQRKEAMHLAKMAGLGLLMYATDYDDELPTADMFGQDVILPYLKDDSFKGRFVYTLKGGSVTGFRDPAGTALGYVPGPGGYAVVYVDGHTEWKNGTPPKRSQNAAEAGSQEALACDKSPPSKKTLKIPELSAYPIR